MSEEEKFRQFDEKYEEETSTFYPWEWISSMEEMALGLRQ